MIDLSTKIINGLEMGSVERADLETDLLDVMYNLDVTDDESFDIVDAVIKHLDRHYTLTSK